MNFTRWIWLIVIGGILLFGWIWRDSIKKYPPVSWFTEVADSAKNESPSPEKQPEKKQPVRQSESPLEDTTDDAVPRFSGRITEPFMSREYIPGTLGDANVAYFLPAGNDSLANALYLRALRGNVIRFLVSAKCVVKKGQISLEKALFLADSDMKPIAEKKALPQKLKKWNPALSSRPSPLIPPAEKQKLVRR